MDTRYFDLYLFEIDSPDDLYKISHLSYSDAQLYADYWVGMSDSNDYILVLEDSTPWNDQPTIIEKSPEWISLKYQELWQGE